MITPDAALPTTEPAPRGSAVTLAGERLGGFVDGAEVTAEIHRHTEAECAGK